MVYMVERAIVDMVNMTVVDVVNVVDMVDGGLGRGGRSR